MSAYILRGLGMKIIENFVRYSSYRIKLEIVFGIFLVIILITLFIKQKKDLKKFFKSLFMLLALICIGLFGVGMSVAYCSEYIEASEKYEKLLEREILTLVPGIVCWGDSLTEGADSDFEPYPSELSDLLVNHFTGKCIERTVIPIVNMGVGGEDSINIVGRSGNIPFTVHAFQIESEVSPVEFSFCPINEKEVKIGRNYSLNGVNPCSINGIIGDVSLVDGSYYFTRREEGEAYMVSEGTELITFASGKWKDYITIIYMGANGGYSDIADLIYQQHAIIDSLEENNHRFLVITSTGEDRKTHMDVETAMEKEYGEKYLNLRDYLCSEAMEDFGIVPTEQDLMEMEQGIVPSSLRQDGIHYNELGTKAVAYCIFEKLCSLGYFDELNEYVCWIDNNLD